MGQVSHGPIGTLRPPPVAVEGLEAEMALVKQAEEGRMSIMELATHLADLWLNAKRVLAP